MQQTKPFIFGRWCIPIICFIESEIEFMTKKLNNDYAIKNAIKQKFVLHTNILPPLHFSLFTQGTVERK